MKALICLVVAVVAFHVACVKGYEDGFRVGRRHAAELLLEVKSDIMIVCDQMPAWERGQLLHLLDKLRRQQQSEMEK